MVQRRVSLEKKWARGFGRIKHTPETVGACGGMPRLLDVQIKKLLTRDEIAVLDHRKSPHGILY